MGSKKATAIDAIKDPANARIFLPDKGEPNNSALKGLALMETVQVVLTGTVKGLNNDGWSKGTSVNLDLTGVSVANTPKGTSLEEAMKTAKRKVGD